jgi:erythromycin esterase-like protein
MTLTESLTLADQIRTESVAIVGDITDYDALLQRIGSAPLVLIGEASHGTHDFYHERARITQRLIEEQNFTAVAVEADWPDALRVNRFVQGGEDDVDANSALRGFERFPVWMWRNHDVMAFVSWLRGYNDALNPGQPKVGFYGLDLYSLYASIESVLQYLDRVDPEAGRRARYRYSCFEQFGEDTQAYGYAASFGLTKSCEEGAVRQLLEIQRAAASYAQKDGQPAADEYFYAEQNARVIKDAEEYYRTMFQGRVSSWNLRDRHMAQTLDALVRHIESQRRPAKIVVWEHNSHVGDARATEMGRTGEFNVGQLARERYGDHAFLVGLTTYSGTVTAASEWGGPHYRKRVVPGLKHSYEELFHSAGMGSFLLLLQKTPLPPRLERAIGVIYMPQSERRSHYFMAEMSRQFDAVIHIDETSAVVPLDPTEPWDREFPETFPSGL